MITDQIKQKLAEYESIVGVAPPIDREGFDQWMTQAKDKLAEVEELYRTAKQESGETLDGNVGLSLLFGSVSALLEAAADVLSS